MRKRIVIIYGIVAASAVIYFGLIKIVGSGIPCFYRKMTGILCPGCGAGDMLVALSELKIAQAFLCNPFVFLLIAVWTAVAIFYFVKNRMSDGDRLFLKILIIVSIIAAIAFAVIRNVY